ncbi:zinc-binding dehydrogenase [Paraburkholderia strydomiana]
MLGWSSADHEAMNRMLEFHQIRSSIARSFTFEEATEAYRYLESSAHVGAVVIELGRTWHLYPSMPNADWSTNGTVHLRAVIQGVVPADGNSATTAGGVQKTRQYSRKLSLRTATSNPTGLWTPQTRSSQQRDDFARRFANRRGMSC